MLSSYWFGYIVLSEGTFMGLFVYPSYSKSLGFFQNVHFLL